MSDSCQAPPVTGAVPDIRKKGIVTALIHRMDLMMLASIKPRREYKSSAPARTVQMLARWAEKPRMAASIARMTSADMTDLYSLTGQRDRARPEGRKTIISSPVLNLDRASRRLIPDDRPTVRPRRKQSALVGSICDTRRTLLCQG